MRNLIYKIYVEVERARLTHRLAKIKEEEGDIAGAAVVMLELQVHNFYIIIIIKLYTFLYNNNNSSS